MDKLRTIYDFEKLSIDNLSDIDGGFNLHNFLLDTATECAVAAGISGGVTPLGGAMAIAAAGFACAGALESIWE